MQRKHFLLSRTDSIGDVVLSLPMAGIIKELYPNSKVSFLGRSYTKSVLECSEYIDEVYVWDEVQNKGEGEKIGFFKDLKADVIIHVFPNFEIASLARLARIPQRIGTNRRLFHWFTCNNLVSLKRFQSELHEAQLNLQLLTPISAKPLYDLEEIPSYYGFSRLPKLERRFRKLSKSDKFNLVLHPKSNGSSKEWGLEKFKELISLLPEESFNIFVTGTEDEGKVIRKGLGLSARSPIIDLSGALSLPQLIAFLNEADGIVASSTGPLHIASAIGKHAIGIFLPMRPLHPKRWAPLGKLAKVFVREKDCSDCKLGARCACIESIKPEDVAEYLFKIANQKLEIDISIPIEEEITPVPVQEPFTISAQ